MGLLSGDIGLYMQEEYGMIDGDVSSKRRTRIVQHRIYEDLGGSYQAQEELLKPVMEYLDELSGITRFDIYTFFKNTEASNYGWFYEWSYGKKYLINDVKQVCEKYEIDPEADWDVIEPYLDEIDPNIKGIALSQWEEWIITGRKLTKRKPDKPSVAEEYMLGNTMVWRILNEIKDIHGIPRGDVSSWHKLVHKLQRERSIEIIKKGYFEYFPDPKNLEIRERVEIEPWNYYVEIGMKLFRPPRVTNFERYFSKNLFDGMSVQEIWEKFRSE
ncbi:MAG: hypothetical protein GF317_22280 [Candidatus Lokiarchaeota archaeon]|nr:hypothetical protein [Candidatus Lokiarchaeota archaeon]MBD3202189.1 hypothetical protein [Candidatus Lokiarchaeota archaeon]